MTTKTEFLLVRVAPVDKQALRAIAGCPRGMSKVVRKLIQQEAKQLGLWPPPVERKEVLCATVHN